MLQFFSNCREKKYKITGLQEKLALFAEADIAINPVVAGAGVNIKTLEFLSAGIPLFSTLFGIRGLELVDQKHYIHAEQEDFADKLNEYAGRPKQLDRIASNGKKYINNHYSWKSIAEKIYEAIEKTLSI